MENYFLSIGTGPGIGLNTAIRFTIEGYTPILTSRSPEKLRVMASRIEEATGQKAETVTLDVLESRQIIALAGRYGPQVDVLHYNAAALHPHPLDAIPYDSLESEIHLDVTAALVAVKAFSPFMTSKKSGTILLTGGGLGVEPSYEFLTMSVGKAGIRAAAQALHPVFLKDNVHLSTLTVAKNVSPDDAKAIGDAFWEIHCQPSAQWTWETTYR